MDNCALTQPQHTSRNANIALLKILSINTNSLVALNKRYNLLQFISKNNIDIALTCETKLNHRHKIQFANYNIIRTDRSPKSKGGGTAIIIKNTIPFDVLSFL